MHGIISLMLGKNAKPGTKIQDLSTNECIFFLGCSASIPWNSTQKPLIVRNSQAIHVFSCLFLTVGKVSFPLSNSWQFIPITLSNCFHASNLIRKNYFWRSLRIFIWHSKRMPWATIQSISRTVGSAANPNCETNHYLSLKLLIWLIYDDERRNPYPAAVASERQSVPCQEPEAMIVGWANHRQPRTPLPSLCIIFISFSFQHFTFCKNQGFCVCLHVGCCLFDRNCFTPWILYFSQL